MHALLRFFIQAPQRFYGLLSTTAEGPLSVTQARARPADAAPPRPLPRVYRAPATAPARGPRAGVARARRGGPRSARARTRGRRPWRGDPSGPRPARAREAWSRHLCRPFATARGAGRGPGPRGVTRAEVSFSHVSLFALPLGPIEPVFRSAHVRPTPASIGPPGSDRARARAVTRCPPLRATMAAPRSHRG